MLATTLKYVPVVFRFAALLSGLGWGISIVAVFVSSKSAFVLLSDLAGSEILYHPVLDYWLRMCAVGFSFIGLLNIMSLWQKCEILRLPLGCLNLILAIILVAWNCRIGIESTVQFWDIMFLVVTGIPLIAWAVIPKKYFA